MELITKELLKEFQKNNEINQNSKNPLIIAKYFTPWSNWTWYATEYDEETKIFFGYVEGFEKEWGYFSLEELKEVNGPFGLKIERDLHFGNKHIKDVINENDLVCN